MLCRFCGGGKVKWKHSKTYGHHTFCNECKRRNCERGTSALPHGPQECARAQLQLKMS